MDPHSSPRTLPRLGLVCLVRLLGMIAMQDYDRSSSLLQLREHIFLLCYKHGWDVVFATGYLLPLFLLVLDASSMVLLSRVFNMSWSNPVLLGLLLIPPDAYSIGRFLLVSGVFLGRSGRFGSLAGSLLCLCLLGHTMPLHALFLLFPLVVCAGPSGNSAIFGITVLHLCILLAVYHGGGSRDLLDLNGDHTRPDGGIYWYLFIEMFEPARSVFVCVVNGLALFLPLPLYLRIGSLGNLALSLMFVTSASARDREAAHISTRDVLVGSVLLFRGLFSVLADLWMAAQGSGSANFAFFASLLTTLSQVFLLLHTVRQIVRESTLELNPEVAKQPDDYFVFQE